MLFRSSHLMRWLKESGLAEMLPELLTTRVYAGISAGSIVTNPDLGVSSEDRKIYYEEKFGYKSEEALNFVDMYTRPHYNSVDFPNARKEYLENIAKQTQKTIYALDDQSALKILDGKIEVVTEGDYLKL